MEHQREGEEGLGNTREVCGQCHPGLEAYHGIPGYPGIPNILSSGAYHYQDQQPCPYSRDVERSGVFPASSLSMSLFSSSSIVLEATLVASCQDVRVIRVNE